MKKMRNYLSFGGGVNSVAMMLMLLDQGVEFEAIFADHETDWPETYDYLEMFQGWLKDHGRKQITVLKAHHKIIKTGEVFDSLYDFCLSRKMVPSFMNRWCTHKFKIVALKRYVKPPCFQFLGIDAGESHRAKLKAFKGVENRFPLIEANVNRAECKKIITDHGLPVPMKSGCYICPYQRRTQWIELRHKHPCLFKKAVDLEQINIESRIERGKAPLYLSQSYKGTLPNVVEETQAQIFEEDEYPPCNCGL